MIPSLLWRFLGLFVRISSLWSVIDSRPVVVFVGPNGSGKSLAAVASLLPVLAGQEWVCSQVHHHHHRPFRDHADGCDFCEVSNKAGAQRCPVGAGLLREHGRGMRQVLSTCRLTLPDGSDHPLWVPFTDYRQLLTFEHGEVFMDEVAGVSDSSGSASMPVQVINHLHKLRHFDCTLRVTTPAFARCSLPIRQAAQVLVDCRAFFPDRSRQADGDRRRWRPRRGFLFVAFDAFSFEEYTAGKREKLPRMASGLFWRPGSPAERSYDTLDQVLALGHVSGDQASGMCMVCGGHRTRPRCACEDRPARGRKGTAVDSPATDDGQGPPPQAGEGPGSGAAGPSDSPDGWRPVGPRLVLPGGAA